MTIIFVDEQVEAKWLAWLAEHPEAAARLLQRAESLRAIRQREFTRKEIADADQAKQWSRR